MTYEDIAKDRYPESRRVTLVGAAVDLGLGVSKIAVGKFAHSQALIADGVHSLSDLATDALVIWAAREASREPDEDHPYGHQRIETVSTIVLGLMLVAVAMGIAYDSAAPLWRQDEVPTPSAWALGVAAISVVAKELIYRYTIRVAERIRSELLRSNAWHSRTDALSSVVVIVGVGGSLFGVTYLDAVAAIVVAVMILWVGGTMIWNGVSEVIDTAVERETQIAIARAAQDVEGVVDVHEMRTRRMGAEIYLDGHVLVRPRVSVSEGHRVAEAVRARLRREFDNLSDITIHIDAEDDGAYQRSAHLPLRQDILEQLARACADLPEYQQLQNLTLHYLDGHIEVEAWLPLDEFDTLDQVRAAQERLQAGISSLPQVRRCKILFC